MTTTITDAEALTARVAAGGAFLDAREPGWLHRIDLAKLALQAPCKCVLGQLATDRYGLRVRDWTWTGICDEFGIDAPDDPGSSDYDLGFNACRKGDMGIVPPAEWDALTAEWRHYIEARRAASA